MSDLKSAFIAFASFGSPKAETEIDNAHLSKLCKECGLVDKKFSTTDVDLLFNKIKTKGARKVTFEQFSTTFVAEVAAKKGISVQEVEAIVCKSAPASSGTQAEETRFHDDKSQYTGVHKAGGPSTVDDRSMESHMKREKQSDARGVVSEDSGVPPAAKKEAPRKESTASEEKKDAPKPDESQKEPTPPAEERKSTPPRKQSSSGSSHDLKSAFIAFASFGSPKAETEIDNAHLSKLCKECGLVDKKFSTTDVDLLFNKIKTKGARKVTFEQFRDGFLPEAAAKKGVTAESLEQIVCSSAPASSGTQAEETRFHDDKSQYTGVHKAGGPSTVDDRSMESHMKREKQSDARGVV